MWDDTNNANRLTMTLIKIHIFRASSFSEFDETNPQLAIPNKLKQYMQQTIMLS